MKRTFFFLLSASLLAYTCKPAASGNETPAADTAATTVNVITNPAAVPGASDTIVDITENPDAYADYYIVIADTGTDYRALHKEMLQLHAATGLQIDSLERYYNEEKDSIVLPDDNEDELYAGDHCMRREPDEFLSVEYLNVYTPHSEGGTMALVTGIYREEAKANAALPAVRARLSNAFVLKGRVYIGCMH
jgi:hypothetical protein